MTEEMTGQETNQSPESPAESTVPLGDQREGTSQPSDSQPMGDDQFIRVPKDRLQDWGGRWGDALKDGSQYRQISPKLRALEERTGMTVDQILETLEQGEPDPSESQSRQDPNAQQPSEPADPDDKPMTVREWKQLQAQQEAEKKKAESLQRTQQELAQARRRESEFARDTLKEAGFEFPEDDSADIPLETEAEMHRFYGLVTRAAREAVPSHWSEQRKQQFISSPAGQDVLKQAAEYYKNLRADGVNKTVSEFASKQQQTPGSTLGSGSGGKAPPKNWEKMSQEERVSALVPTGPDD